MQKSQRINQELRFWNQWRILNVAAYMLCVMIFIPPGCQKTEESRDASEKSKSGNKAFQETADSTQADLPRGPQGEIIFKHPQRVKRAEFSPDGKLVVAHCSGGAVYVWDLATGKQFGKTIQHDKLSSAMFGLDSKTLILGSEGGKLWQWDLTAGTSKGDLLKNPEPIFSAGLSPDGQTLLIGSLGSARFWDFKTGKPRSEKLKQNSPVTTVAFTPDGKTAATGNWDNQALIWDVETGKLKGKPCQHKGMVVSVMFSSDGKTLMTSGSVLSFSDALSGVKDKTVHLWDAETGESLGEAFQHQDSINDLAISPDGKTLITGSRDKNAFIWDVAAQHPVAGPVQHEDEINAVAFSPDGKSVLTASDDQTVRIWEVAKIPLSEEAAKYNPNKLRKHLKWDVSKDQLTVDLLKHREEVSGVAFSPDGTILASGSYDYTARLWNVATGELIGKPLKHEYYVNAIAFFPDGKTLITGDDGYNVHFWNVETGERESGRGSRTNSAAKSGKSPSARMEHSLPPSVATTYNSGI